MGGGSVLRAQALAWAAAAWRRLICSTLRSQENERRHHQRRLRAAPLAQVAIYFRLAWLSAISWPASKRARKPVKVRYAEPWTKPLAWFCLLANCVYLGAR